MNRVNELEKEQIEEMKNKINEECHHSTAENVGGKIEITSHCGHTWDLVPGYSCLDIEIKSLETWMQKNPNHISFNDRCSPEKEREVEFGCSMSTRETLAATMSCYIEYGKIVDNGDTVTLFTNSNTTAVRNFRSLAEAARMPVEAKELLCLQALKCIESSKRRHLN